MRDRFRIYARPNVADREKAASRAPCESSPRSRVENCYDVQSTSAGQKSGSTCLTEKHCHFLTRCPQEFGATQDAVSTLVTTEARQRIRSSG